MTPYTPRNPTSKYIYACWCYGGPAQPRATFAQHLLILRKRNGVRDAIHFRDWMIYLGSYPVRVK